MPCTRAWTLISAVTALCFSLFTSAAEYPVSCETDRVMENSKTPPQAWCEKDGLRDGDFREFHPSGKIKIEANYRKNLRHGRYRAYSEYGIILNEGSYEDGAMSGHWIRRNDDGSLRDEGEWKDDAPTGLWRLYTQGGYVGTEGYFESGSRVCDWYSYPSSGGYEKEPSKALPKDGNCSRFSIHPRYRFTRSRLDFFRFSIGLMNLRQESGGSSNTFVFGVMPQGKISPRLSWFASASFGFLPTRTPGQRWSLISDLAPGFRIFTPGPEWLFVDVSAGVQTLLKSGTCFTTSLGVGVDPGMNGILIKIQTKSVHDQDNPAQELLLGAEFSPEAILGLFH